MAAGAVIVKASSAYRRWLGGAGEVRIRVDGPLSLGQLLGRLSAEQPGFPPLPFGDPGRLQAEVLVFAAGRFLRPDDIVTPGMTIELLPPTAGG